MTMASETQLVLQLAVMFREMMICTGCFRAPAEAAIVAWNSPPQACNGELHRYTSRFSEFGDLEN